VWSVRTVYIDVQTALPWSPDGDGAHISGHDLTESGRALSSSSERSLYIVRTRVTSLLLSEAASVRTSSIHRSDGDPTEAIKTPTSRISSYPTKSELLAACELFVFEFFGFLHFSHIPGIVFRPFSLQFSFRLLECYFFWNMRCIYLPC
jgi:hypothetical protein